MLQKMKNRIKDQRGLTLIELLAVIVILGIIAAIAVPSITGIINNSKEDAHIANAEQIARAAKIYIADEKINVTSTAQSVTLQSLIDKGYLEDMEDPSGIGYDNANSKLYFLKSSSSPVTYTYSITLKSVGTTAVNYIGSGTDATGAVDVTTLTRDIVNTP